MYLSKSQYIRGLQCVKSLWLYKYKRKEAVTPPGAATQVVFDIGSRVGELACQLFPDGEAIVFEGTTFEEKIALTKKYMEEGVENIYEATFNFNGMLVMVDILHRGVDGWEIFEVKSSTEVKDVYVDDASIQYYVLNGCGLDVNSVSIVHINNKYVRGEELEINKLFTIVDLTDDVKELQEQILLNLDRLEDVVDNKEDEPSIDIGMHCFKPYECDCKEYCWKGVPDYSIFDLAGIRKDKAFDIYSQGVQTIQDIQDISIFSAGQQIQIESELQNKTIINHDAIRTFLNEMTYPLYHLDFETFQQAIPEFEGVSPYQQIPFQYSLHIEHKNSSPVHKEFLAEEGIDPRKALAERLVNDIPVDVMVLAYNMGFEKGVIRKLADRYPEMPSDLMAIHNNIKDLMTPFQKKYYYVPSMRGSYSIKSVMPALVPEMDQAYKDLEGIHNGGEAMNAYASLHLKDLDDRLQIRSSLLEYCKLDTLSMIKILEKLRNI